MHEKLVKNYTARYISLQVTSRYTCAELATRSEGCSGICFSLAGNFQFLGKGGVNRTLCHTACTDVNTVSTQHIELICFTLARGLSCAFHEKVIPSLVPRHVS